MEANFARCLEAVLAEEGGFVDHPSDPGGATNRGVTIANFRRYVKADGTVADLKRLTAEQAGIVFKKQYWDKVKGDYLPSGIDHAVFDFAVNSGVSRSSKYLQRVLGVAQDGIIGPKTLEAADEAWDRAVINSLCDDRLAFLMRLKTWPVFGKGWAKRVARVRALSLQLAASPSVIPVPPKLPEQSWLITVAQVVWKALVWLFRKDRK